MFSAIKYGVVNDMNELFYVQGSFSEVKDSIMKIKEQNKAINSHKMHK